MYADPQMPELPMGFLEHAKWQHTGMQAKRLADLDWWCHQLHGAPLQPLLTSDLPRSGKANIGQNPGGIVKVCKQQHANNSMQKLPTHFKQSSMFIWTYHLCVCAPSWFCKPLVLRLAPHGLHELNKIVGVQEHFSLA